MDKSINQEVSSKFNGAVKEAKSGIQDAKSTIEKSVQQAGERTRAAMGDVKGFMEDEAPDYLRTALADVKETADKALDLSRSTITKYPFYSVLGAVTAGALLGAFLTRSRK